MPKDRALPQHEKLGVSRILPRLNHTTRCYEIVDDHGTELYSEPLNGQPAGYHTKINRYAEEWAIMLDLPLTAVQPFTVGEWQAPNA